MSPPLATSQELFYRR